MHKILVKIRNFLEAASSLTQIIHHDFRRRISVQIDFVQQSHPVTRFLLKNHKKHNC